MMRSMQLHGSVATGALLVAVVGVIADNSLAVVKPRTLTTTDSYVQQTRPAPFAPRSAQALSGRAFMARIAKLPERRREAAIFAEIVAGNVPDHLRTLSPVKLASRDARGRTVTATIWALPDYLAVGSNDDFVRVPMGLETASRLAIHLGMALPTAKIVDEIYASANLKLAPQPLPPTREMTSVAYAVRHDDAVRASLGNRLPGGMIPAALLIAGHKKDIVMSTRLERRKDRVAIFGWHRPSGKPIQPLSTVHGSRYADYSHGVRLVSATVFVDGRSVDIEEALDDRAMAALFSYEGRFATYASLLETAAHAGRPARGERPRLFAVAVP